MRYKLVRLCYVYDVLLLRNLSWDVHRSRDELRNCGTVHCAQMRLLRVFAFAFALGWVVVTLLCVCRVYS